MKLVELCKNYCSVQLKFQGFCELFRSNCSVSLSWIFFFFGHMPNILSSESEFQRNYVREAKGPVHHAPNHPVECHREHNPCAGRGRMNSGALFVGRAVCICSHPHMWEGKNKSGCSFHEKHFPWQKSTADNTELWLGLDSIYCCACICLGPYEPETAGCWSGAARAAAQTLCWYSSEGEAKRITNELVCQRLEMF